MTDFGDRKPEYTGYGTFCPCRAEMFASGGVMTCEKGHKWTSRVEGYTFHPHGPKYKAHYAERVVWTRAEEAKA